MRKLLSIIIATIILTSMSASSAFAGTWIQIGTERHVPLYDQKHRYRKMVLAMTTDVYKYESATSGRWRYRIKNIHLKVYDLANKYDRFLVIFPNLRIENADYNFSNGTYGSLEAIYEHANSSDSINGGSGYTGFQLIATPDKYVDVADKTYVKTRLDIWCASCSNPDFYKLPELGLTVGI